jgi:hypothetical protein
MHARSCQIMHPCPTPQACLKTHTLICCMSPCRHKTADTAGTTSEDSSGLLLQAQRLHPSSQLQFICGIVDGKAMPADARPNIQLGKLLH